MNETNNTSKSQMPRRSMTRKPAPKGPRVFRISIHPLILITSVLLLIFFAGGLLNSGGNSVEQVSVDQFIRSIKEGDYSQVVIQDSGEILAQDKYLLTVDVDSNGAEISIPAETKASVLGDDLQKMSLSDLIDELEEVDPLQQLRNAVLGGDSAQVLELVVLEDSVLVRRAGVDSNDSIIEGVTEDQLREALRVNDVSLQDQRIVLTLARNAAETVALDNFSTRAENGDFVAVYDIGGSIFGRILDTRIDTYAITWDGGIRSFAAALQAEGISLSSDFVQIGSNAVSTVPWGDIISIITLVGFIVLGVLLFRGIQNSGNSLMRFGQSRARMFWGVKPDVTFADVAGVDEAREELDEIVQFLRTPDKFRKLGARIPKGVLMVGAPGTGKTLLARAIAGEAGVPFFHTSGSEFEEMLVGAGASRVRDLFEKAKKSAPSLIFIDEIDAVARKRGTTIQSSTTEQTLNQILVEMDGFEQNTNVIVIAATNRPDVLDPAILRPGRFDRRVVLDLPDIEGRKKILEIHAKNKPLADDVDLEKVAKRTTGFAGAELENTLNEAAIIAAKNNRKEITAPDIEEAATKVTMGPAKRSQKRTDEELNLIAVHEAGHAVVSKFVPKTDPVHRVSIVSRGMAGGVTHFLPQDDNRIVGREKLLSRIVVSLGGRAAEEIVLDDVSTGASGDIDTATNIARTMVQKYGMSEKLGLIKYGESNELQYLGYGYGEQRDYSDDTAKIIDEEVRKIMEDSYERAKSIINEHRDKLDKLVEMLLEHEVVESDEFLKLFE